MLRHLYLRNLGLIRPWKFGEKEILKRTYSLELSNMKSIHTGSETSILSLDFDHSDERFLISGDLNSTISLYDMLDTADIGEVRNFEPCVTISKHNHVRGHRSGVTCVSWYPHDTGLFLSGSYDGSVRVWDPNKVEMVHKFQFEPPVNALSMSPIKSHRPFVAVGTQESDIYLCDLRLGCKGRVLSAHSASITALAWDLGDENLLVSGCSDGTMCMWDIRFPKFFVSFDQSVHLGDKIELEAYNERREQGMPAAHCGAVSSVCFVPGRRQILSSGADQAMHLWDVDYGTNLLVHYPNIQNKGTVKISTSSDGVLVYHPCRRQICVFDIKTGKKVRTLSGHYENVKVSVFHPHLQELYSGSADGEILIWVPSGDQKGRLDPSAVAADARKYRTGSDERRDPGADAEIQECDWYEDEGL